MDNRMGLGFATDRPDGGNDIDVGQILKGIGQHRTVLFSSVVVAGILTYVGLFFVQPVYTAQSRILVENEENGFTRSTFNQAASQQDIVDNAAVGSQVQVLQSNDLAQKVIRKLDLVRLFQSRSSGKVTEEMALREFTDNIKVSHIANTHVISVQASSHSPGLSARIANQLSDQYIAWQQKAKLNQTIGATDWLKEQIEGLRKKVSTGEAGIQQFRSSQDIITGTNNTTLDVQQLTAVNNQLVLARAKVTETAARLAAITEILERNGDVNGTSEILQSTFIQRLLERRVRIESRLSELAATLLPSHPRVKRLRAELGGLRSQIISGMKRVVASLKNEARIARSREASLRNSLETLKKRSGKNSQARARLKEMERDLKSNRTTLEGYMDRYHDASGRRDTRALPTQATIISRAHTSSVPSFPKKLPLTLLVMFATGLLGLLYVGTRVILGLQKLAVPVDGHVSGEEGAVKGNDNDMASGRPVDAGAAVRAKKVASRTSLLQQPALASLGSGDMSGRSGGGLTSLPMQDFDASNLARHIGAISGNRKKYLVAMLENRSGEVFTGDIVAMVRDLAVSGRTVMMVDIHPGNTCFPKVLGLSRTPGFAELVTGQASFEEVVHPDPEGTGQVILSGEPRVLDRDTGASRERMASIFEALGTVYDVVLVYGDMAMVTALLEMTGSEREPDLLVLPAADAMTLDSQLAQLPVLPPVIRLEEERMPVLTAV